MKILRKLILCMLPLAHGVISAAETTAEWVVKDAPVRFMVELTREPTHPSAGYFVKIPDGGVLPAPRLESVVVDQSGTIIKSGILWYSQDNYCALVFQTPESGESVSIYFRAARSMNLWSPESGITPGALLCETPGSRDKRSVQRMANLGPVSAKARFVNQGWDCGSWDGQLIPLATWEWRLGGNAAYILAHIDVDAPGPTWIAPQIRKGNMDILIDGKTVKQRKKNEKLGGIGGTVDLSRGLHRVELYCYNARGGSTGPMMFTWRTPETTIEELGGARAEDLRYPGTPMCESSIIDINRIVKSGECRITNAAAQSAPIASFSFEPTSVFWLDDEVPLIAYSFKPRIAGNPGDTSYSWSFEQNSEARAEDAEVSWLLKAGTFTKVTLTAEADRKRSVATYTIYPHTDIESSMNDPATLEDFKLACYHMLRAFPDNVDPTADWGPSMWNNFFRVMELKGANALLEYMVTQRWEFIRNKLDPQRKALLQDVFLFAMASRKPDVAFEWATKFANREFTTARATVLKLKRAELLMYYLDDLEGARRIIAPLLRDSGEGGEWAKIRMGDVELLSGNLNAATARYGDVQSRSKALSAEAVSKTLSSLTPASEAKLARTREPDVDVMGKELNSVRAQERRDKNAVSVPNKFVPMQQPASVPDWKLAAIRDVAASENISILIDQNFHLEAYRALRLWERALPMSKISGDFILREAKLYMALKDYKRARAILSAYCEQVDLSNFLPEAMSMIKQCMIEMREPAAEIQRYEQEIMKRTVFGAGAD